MCSVCVGNATNSAYWSARDCGARSAHTHTWLCNWYRLRGALQRLGRRQYILVKFKQCICVLCRAIAQKAVGDLSFTLFVFISSPKFHNLQACIFIKPYMNVQHTLDTFPHTHTHMYMHGTCKEYLVLCVYI